MPPKKKGDGGKKKGGGGKRPADLPEGYESYGDYVRKEVRMRFVLMCKEAQVEPPSALIKYFDQHIEDDKPVSAVVAAGRAFSVGALQALLTVLKSWAPLKTLCVWRSTAGDDAAAHVADLLRLNPSVNTIELLDIGMSPRGCRALGEALAVPGGNTTLKYLLLDHNVLGDSGAQLLCQGLRGNQDLATLSLRYCDIGAAGVTAIADEVLGSTKVQYLKLRGNKAGDEGAAAVAKRLTRTSHIKVLDLVDNAVSAAGAGPLLHAVARAYALEVFDFDANPIGAPGAEAVVDALTTRKRLIDEFAQRAVASGAGAGAAGGDADSTPMPGDAPGTPKSALTGGLGGGSGASDPDLAPPADAAGAGSGAPPPEPVGPSPLQITMTERVPRALVERVKEASELLAPTKKKGKKKK